MFYLFEVFLNVRVVIYLYERLKTAKQTETIKQVQTLKVPIMLILSVIRFILTLL